MDKQVRNKWGYAPIAVGLALIFFGIIILVVSIVTNGITYETAHFFWHFLAPLISYSLVVGSFVTVIGLAILRKITNVFSYVSITCGFILIIIDVYTLLINSIYPYINDIGFDNLNTVSLFSYLMAGAFFMTLGIIIGLRVRGKIGYVSIAGGLALILLGVSILWFNLETHTSSNLYLNLRLSWAPAISYSLIAGTFFAVVGTAYLIWVRK